MANPNLSVIPYVATNVFIGYGHNASTVLKTQAKFLNKINGGVVVPWFDDKFEAKSGDYDLKDSQSGKTITMKTDEGGQVDTTGSIFYSSWNMTYATSMYDDGSEGYAMQWGVDSESVSNKASNISWNNAFYVHSGGSGKDHRQSYYFGDTRKFADEKGNRTEKIFSSHLKNVLGLYWTWKKVSTSYYSVIGKIVFEYVDDNGKLYHIIPPQQQFDDAEKKDGHYQYAPGVNGDAKSTYTVNRGVGLNSRQALFVVDRGLYFKGIHIQVNRETPSQTGTGDPKGWFFNFTPWILGDSEIRFDDGFCLTMWDKYATEVLDKNINNFNASFNLNSIGTSEWSSEGLKQRVLYFSENENVEPGKQLIKVRNSNKDSIEYASELLEVKPVPIIETPSKFFDQKMPLVSSNTKNFEWTNLGDGEDYSDEVIYNNP